MENLNSFIQILLWIVLPVLFIAVTVTVVLHYWRKRKVAKDSLEEILEAAPIALQHPPVIEPAINIKPENKEGTMSYNDELEKNREIITHLKSEFSFLEKKYEELKVAQNNKNAASASVQDENTAAINEKLKDSESKVLALNNEIQQVKNKNGEYSRSIDVLKSEIKALENTQNNHLKTEDLKTAELETKLKESELQLVILQEEMSEKLAVKSNDFLQLKSEKEKLLTEVMELKQQPVRKDENYEKLLQEKEKLLAEVMVLKQQPVHNNENYEKLLQENEKLKSKVADYSYFDDLVNEKKQQISFLENQIEQRVRQVHEAEQNFYTELKKVEMYGAQIASLKTEYDDICSKLAEQIKIHDNQLHELDRFKKEVQQQGNIITEKQHFISELENNFKVEKESSALMLQTINTDKTTILQLTQQTEEQLRKIDDLEGKLKISSQLLARIYTDLGKSFASIFSDDINVLPENSKLKELGKSLNDINKEESEVHHPEEFA